MVKLANLEDNNDFEAFLVLIFLYFHEMVTE